MTKASASVILGSEIAKHPVTLMQGSASPKEALVDISLTLNTFSPDALNLTLDNLANLFILAVVFVTLIVGNLRKTPAQE